MSGMRSAGPGGCPGRVDRR